MFMCMIRLRMYMYIYIYICTCISLDIINSDSLLCSSTLGLSIPLSAFFVQSSDQDGDIPYKNGDLNHSYM